MKTDVSPEQWSKALRSGEYKQGRNQLRTPSVEGKRSYCCLGVLADLIDPESWSGSEWRGDHCALPAEQIPAWLSIPQHGRAMWMNDTDGASFGQIADWVDNGMDVEDD